MTSNSLTNLDRRTLSNKHERNALWIKANGTCEQCGIKLDASWEADHKIPYAVSGRTNPHEMAALCRGCNRAKGASLPKVNSAADYFHPQQLEWLRPFQRDFAELLASASFDAVEKYILADVCTGGGKSLLPAVALKILKARNIVDRVCVVCPTTPLKEQIAIDFLDPELRQMVGHNYEINESTNDIDPCRGSDGYSITYAALGLDSSGINAAEFERHRYCIFIDEAHHVARDSVWHRALQPLVDSAAVVVLASGSLERGDQRPIANLPYREVQL